MRQIYFLLTERCNLNCKHCIRGKTVGSKDINFKDAIEAINILFERFPHADLILTGGEPTLHAKFLEILEFGLTKFKRVIVTSNGTTKFYDECFKIKNHENCVFQISIDGDKDKHDAIRGIGSFERSMSAIKKLLEYGHNIEVATTVNELNYLSLKNLYELLVDLKVSRWYVNNELPFGNAYISGIKPLDTELWNKLTLVMKLKCKDIDLKMNKLFNLDDINETNLDYLKNNKNISPNCGSGTEKIYVYPDLNVYGCTCIKDFPFGNLIKDGIDNIFKSENYFKIANYKLLDDSPCKKCNFVDLCNGGCIGMSYNIFKKLGYGDIRCPIVKEFYKRM